MSSDDDTDDRRWLELALAPLRPCRSDPAPPSTPATLPHHHPPLALGLGLGLGLGFYDCPVRKHGEEGTFLPPVPFHHPLDLPPPPPSLLASPLLPPSPLHVDPPCSVDPDDPLSLPPPPLHRARSGLDTGVWFSLRAASDPRNGDGEALPQIPKSYIRVQDENVTIFMVKTYLVRKLGLRSEAEVEITCMGEKLSQWQTLKYVQDAVWFPRAFHSFYPSDFQPYFMSLHYQRTCLFH